MVAKFFLALLESVERALWVIRAETGNSNQQRRRIVLLLRKVLDGTPQHIETVLEINEVVQIKRQ